MFSVLLSVYYNESPYYFRQSIDSLFNQSLQLAEVVLVKDGELTPELENVITEYTAKYLQIRVVPLKQNQGLGKALNEGLKHCSYDLVARMDTDDIAKPNRFEKQIRVFQEHPELDVVGAWIDEFEETTSNIISTRKLPEVHDDICQFAKKRNPENHPVIMFRKQAVLAAGGYQHFPLFEDYYLWIRMWLNGAVFANTGSVLVNVRVGEEMYQRRGGSKYFESEKGLQDYMLKNKMINHSTYIKNVTKRLIIQKLMPNKLRGWVFRTFARKKVS